MEPADGKGLNYKLIDKKPLAFYDQVLGQDVIKKKVFKEREALQSQHSGIQSYQSARRNKKQDAHLTYQETIGKRGVGVLVDEARRHIEEQTAQRRSQSPYRGGVEVVETGGMLEGGYQTISAHNLQFPSVSPLD